MSPAIEGDADAAAGVPPHVLISMAPYVLIPLAAAATGLSEKAIRRKIETGMWIEGREWRRAPDGRIYISVRGYQAWVERGAR